MASTGYVVYYDKKGKEYVLVDGDFIVRKIMSRLSLVLTYSVDTKTKRSHTPLTCEVSAHVSVKGKGVIGIDRVIGELEDFVDAALSYYFNEAIADIAIKEGVEYLSERPTDEVNYPEMKIYLSYANPGKKPRVIEKTYSEFGSERNRFPHRGNRPRGGRERKIKEFI